MTSTISTWIVCVSLLLTSNSLYAQQPSEDDYARLREKMVEEQIKARNIYNDSILDAFLYVKRHLFVPQASRNLAYEDYPIAIGKGQSISQPYIVAYMTNALQPNKNMKVLEIGTGSGYQAAILSRLCKMVYTIEIIDSLGRQAKKNLEQQGYTNIKVKIGDGYEGWAKYAPYDAIIVTCAPIDIPQPLLKQLAEGGRMIIPAGEEGYQKLYILEKRRDKFQKIEALPVRFVPMLRPGKGTY
jgi:protein-L-isoaspartate(D-aspartate) O-methyltransferase